MKAGRLLTSLAAVATLAALGCGVRPQALLQHNQPPEVELFAQRAEGSGPFAFRMSWTAHDPDGQVDHFIYSVGSPGEGDDERLLRRTSERSQVLSFPRTVTTGVAVASAAAEPRVFSVQAVDGSGARSAVAQMAFIGENIAPFVSITSPPANPLVRYYLPSTICIGWQGYDPDGIHTVRPVKYKFKMLTNHSEVTIATARLNPDSVRRYYAPLQWAGWDSTGPDTVQKIYKNLTLDQEYIFVITCFDEAGDYDPLFSFSKNMVYMRCTSGASGLPRLTVSGESFLYQQPTGRFDPNPAMRVEVPAARPLRVNWYADPSYDAQGSPTGAPVGGYRWALDIEDLADETPRSDQTKDLNRWSHWSLQETSAMLPPLTPGPEPHVLYIEARPTLGCAQPVAGRQGRRRFVSPEVLNPSPSFVSLVAIRLDAVQPGFNRELLIVDDTRLRLDQILVNTTCENSANRPIGNWPTQAELDTFLYARGGVPWRCYPAVGGQPQLSSPGIFSGYAFDTLGTNLRVANLTIPLSTLSNYRHVIWLVDGPGALNSKPGTDAGDIAGPTTSMRYMNANGTSNTLAAYVAQGGKVWLAGGGAATASMMNFNRILNDNATPNPRTLTFRFTDNELVPGRFIYDQAHWRSEFKQFRVTNGRIRKYLGRYEQNPGPYQLLPAEILLKTAATDPYPPNRGSQPQSIFYQTQFDAEFLSGANEILEDLDPGPLEDFQSTLDTLLRVTATTLQPDTVLQSVVMTHYHGLDNEQFILTGFNLWSFRRSQCLELTDFVLQQLWGLSRGAPGQAAIGSSAPRLSIGRQVPGNAGAGAPHAAKERSRGVRLASPDR